MSETAWNKRYRGRKVLLTGGRGFIGFRLKKRLTELGAAVYSLDNRPPAPSSLFDIVCDIRDSNALRSAISEVSPEIVFHLAALADRAPDPELIRPMLEANLFGTLNLLDVLRATPSCRSIIVSGTAEEYGRSKTPFTEPMREDPVGPYSFSKTCSAYAARLFFNLYRLPVIVLRPTLAYGPGQAPVMFIPQLIEALKRGEKFPMTMGGQTRDFIYVDDLADAYVKAGVSGTGFGEVFNIGSGDPRSIKEVALKIAELLGKSHLLDIGAKDYRPAEIMEYSVDISRAEKAFGWRPGTSLDEGLKLTLNEQGRP